MSLPIDLEIDIANEILELNRLFSCDLKHLALPKISNIRCENVFETHERLLELEQQGISLLSQVASAYGAFSDKSASEVISLAIEGNELDKFTEIQEKFLDNFNGTQILNLFQNDLTEFRSSFITKKKVHDELFVEFNKFSPLENSSLKESSCSEITADDDSRLTFLKHFYVVVSKRKESVFIDFINRNDRILADELTPVKRDDEFILYKFLGFRKDEEELLASIRAEGFYPKNLVSEIEKNKANKFKEERIRLYYEKRDNLSIFLKYIHNDIISLIKNMKIFDTFLMSILKYGYPASYFSFVIKTKNIDRVYKNISDLLSSWKYSERIPVVNNTGDQIADIDDAIAVFTLENLFT